MDGRFSCYVKQLRYMTMANTLLRNCYTKQVLTFFLSRYRCTNQLVIFTPQFGDKSESRHHRKFTSVEKKDRNEKGIGSSSVFFQDGTSIQELPLIVCKCQTFPSNNCDTPVISSSTDNRTEEDRRHECLVEEEAVKDGFTRCSSLSEIFKLLDIIPVNEVTPKVASHALKCISQLHINSNFKNMSDNINNVFSDGTTETFCWNAIIERLCETVRGSSNVDIILEALQALCVGKSTLNRDVNNGQCQQLINECLLRVAEGCVSLDQTLALALIIHSFASRNKLYAQYVDKLWISILNNYNLINETNISQLFSVVPIFKTSRKTILNILVKRTLSCWWKLKVSDIITILSTFVQVEFVHHSVLRASTKWLNVNIHAVSENDLASIINLLLQLNYMDSNTIRAAEKYIRLCHTNIRNMELVALWADVCVKFRICSPTILDTFTLICTDMKRNFSPSQVFRIARTFGLLNYIPLNNKQFFAFLEDFLSLKFAEFKPDDMIELLLSCTFIQRYPLNFVQKVLNPFFLDRLNRTQSEFGLRKAKINLQLLDAILTLECSQYEGPRLTKNRITKLFYQDARLAKIQNVLCQDFATILGSKNKFAYAEYVPKLPYNDIYRIDFVIHVDSEGKPLEYSENNGIAKRKAIIVHLPEHFTNETRHLIGIQATRIRQLKVLEYDVIQLEYETIEKLRQRPADRMNYLKSTIFK